MERKVSCCWEEEEEVEGRGVEGGLNCYVCVCVCMCVYVCVCVSVLGVVFAAAYDNIWFGWVGCVFVIVT